MEGKILRKSFFQKKKNFRNAILEFKFVIFWNGNFQIRNAENSKPNIYKWNMEYQNVVLPVLFKKKRGFYGLD